MLACHRKGPSCCSGAGSNWKRRSSWKNENRSIKSSKFFLLSMYLPHTWRGEANLEEYDKTLKDLDKNMQEVKQKKYQISGIIAAMDAQVKVKPRQGQFVGNGTRMWVHHEILWNGKQIWEPAHGVDYEAWNQACEYLSAQVGNPRVPGKTKLHFWKQSEPELQKWKIFALHIMCETRSTVARNCNAQNLTDHWPVMTHVRVPQKKGWRYENNSASKRWKPKTEGDETGFGRGSWKMQKTWWEIISIEDFTKNLPRAARVVEFESTGRGNKFVKKTKEHLQAEKNLRGKSGDKLKMVKREFTKQRRRYIPRRIMLEMQKVKNKQAVCQACSSVSPSFLPRIWEAKTAWPVRIQRMSHDSKWTFLFPTLFSVQRLENTAVGARFSGIHCLSLVWTPLNILDKREISWGFRPSFSTLRHQGNRSFPCLSVIKLVWLAAFLCVKKNTLLALTAVFFGFVPLALGGYRYTVVLVWISLRYFWRDARFQKLSRGLLPFGVLPFEVFFFFTNVFVDCGARGAIGRTDFFAVSRVQGNWLCVMCRGSCFLSHWCGVRECLGLVLRTDTTFDQVNQTEDICRSMYNVHRAMSSRLHVSHEKNTSPLEHSPVAFHWISLPSFTALWFFSASVFYPVSCGCSILRPQNCNFSVLDEKILHHGCSISGSSVSIFFLSMSCSYKAITVLRWPDSRIRFLYTLSWFLFDGTSWVDHRTPSQLVYLTLNSEIDVGLVSAPSPKRIRRSQTRCVCHEGIGLLLLSPFTPPSGSFSSMPWQSSHQTTRNAIRSSTNRPLRF